MIEKLFEHSNGRIVNKPLHTLRTEYDSCATCTCKYIGGGDKDYNQMMYH